MSDGEPLILNYTFWDPLFFQPKPFGPGGFRPAPRRSIRFALAVLYFMRWKRWLLSLTDGLGSSSSVVLAGCRKANPALSEIKPAVAAAASALSASANTSAQLPKSPTNVIVPALPELPLAEQMEMAPTLHQQNRRHSCARDRRGTKQ